jgi:hypothetical protein
LESLVLYLSVSSAFDPSIFVVGRSETGGPRALINAGRALAFPPRAVAAATTEAPLSLPLGGATPPLPGAG